MLKVSVIILNWNGENDTIECINSLINQVDVELDILVIDNGSKKESVSKIERKFPKINVIKSESNLGYCGGMNLGIRLAIKKDAKFLLLLNNDTVADKNFVKTLLKNFEKDVGVVGPIIYYYDDPDKIWSFGGKISPIILELTRSHEHQKEIPTKPFDRDFITGCAMLVKREVFEKVGVFDERFFPAYYEDLDFCFRVRKAGYKIILDPTSFLWHKVSKSSNGSESENLIFLVARNSGFYFRKHLKLWNFFPIILYRLFSGIKKTIFWSFQKKKSLIKAYWCGFFVGWTGISLKCQKYYLEFYSKSN